MNYDLVAAIIALIRGSSTGTAIGGRIYEGSQVPANVPFPRCYVNLRQSPGYLIYNRRDGAVDRRQRVEVLFAENTASSPTPFKNIETWDKQVRVLLEYNVVVANLVTFNRIADVPTTQQANDLDLYVMGGGLYEAYYQEG